MELKILVNSELDDVLYTQWEAWVVSNGTVQTPASWVEYMKQLDGVEDAAFVTENSIHENHSLLQFKSEEHKNWFLLKWS